MNIESTTILPLTTITTAAVETEKEIATTGTSTSTPIVREEMEDETADIGEDRNSSIVVEESKEVTLLISTVTKDNIIDNISSSTT